MKKLNKKTGQNLLEYTLLIGIIVLIVFSMSPMIKRGSQGMIKVVADQIGDQKDSDQLPYDQSGMTFKEVFKDGSLTKQLSDSQVIQRKTLDENAGNITYGYNDEITTTVNTKLNLGLTEE